MKIGVVCAMEEEIRLLLNQIEDRSQQIIGGRTFYQGRLNGHDLILVQSGIGKVQAAMNTAIMLTTVACDVVINTGSAGGIGQGLHVGDVVVSDGVAYHDVNSTPFGYLPGQLPDQPQIFESDPKYVREIQAAAVAVGLEPHVGLIVSGDQFVASADQISKILAIYPQALASEMEGAAIGQVCHQFKVPFVVIRAMSDVGDENAQVSFDDFIVEAGRTSAQMLLDFIKRA